MSLLSIIIGAEIYANSCGVANCQAHLFLSAEATFCALKLNLYFKKLSDGIIQQCQPKQQILTDESTGMLFLSARFMAGIFFHTKGCFCSSYCLVFTEIFQCIPLVLMQFADQIKSVYSQSFASWPAMPFATLHCTLKAKVQADASWFI